MLKDLVRSLTNDNTIQITFSWRFTNCMEFHVFVSLIFNGCGKHGKGTSLLPELVTVYKTTRKAQFWCSKDTPCLWLLPLALQRVMEASVFWRN